MRTLRPSLRVLDTRSVKPPPKEVEPHYLSPEHRAWRDEVLRRAGGRCQWRGCVADATIADHIHERRDGGSPLDPANGQALCHHHHKLKTDAARVRRTVSALRGQGD